MKKCIVVAFSQATREYVAASLKSRGIEAVLLASLEELPRTLENSQVSGILLEVKSLIIAPERDKAAVKDFLDLYPFAKFRLAGDQILIAGETLDGFVEKCRLFAARSIRKSVRKAKYLAVYLAADATFKDAEQVVTVNVSDTGVFVYSVREWKAGERVWLQFPGHPRAICGTICSIRPWGNNSTLPGIGVRVDSGDSSSLWNDEILRSKDGRHFTDGS
jgi:hypothetical protein